MCFPQCIHVLLLFQNPLFNIGHLELHVHLMHACGAFILFIDGGGGSIIATVA